MVAATEILATLRHLRSFLAHLAHLDLQALPDTKEMLELQELLAIQVAQDLQDPQANQARQAIPEKKEPQATTEPQEPPANQATTERREPLATMAHLVYQAALDYPAKTVTTELQDPLALKVKLDLLATRSHPRFQAHQAHLVIPAKTELQVTLVDPAQLAQSARLDFKDPLANQAPMATQEAQDRKETLELPVIPEPQARTAIQAHLARFQAHLDPLVLLAHLATAALLARMVSLAALDTQAKMESPEHLDTLV